MNPLEWCRVYKLIWKSLGNCLPTSGGLDTSLISLPRKKEIEK